ncbi:M48 family metalloprotease [candidate division KSB1 bacterium]|nr:M48 family metalloprotease [candidate division KSB1 bacterium]
MKARLEHIVFGVVSFCFLLSCAGSRKTGKLAFVSIDEEIALGQEFAIQAMQRLKLVRNQEITEFLNRMAHEIGAVSDWSGLEYNVYLVNEPDINHFSLPGGHIYIFRGLIEAAETASEVASAIAHEIAHIAARDGVDRMSHKYGYALAAQSVVGQNPEIPRQIIANLYSRDTILDYSKEAEKQADRKCIKYAWKANYDPAGLVFLLLKVRQAEEESPQKVSLLLKTHPATSGRYRSVNNELDSVPDRASLRKDLPEFSAIKNLLRKIPY